MHEFLLQGQDKLYIVHFPMFHLEKHRHQLIMEVNLADNVKQKYLQAKKADPTTVFTIETEEKLALATLVAEKKSFKASIKTRSPQK